MSNRRMPRVIFAMLTLAILIVSFAGASGGALASVGAVDDPPPFSPEDLPDAVRFPRAAVIEAVENGQNTADGGIYTPEIVGGVEVDPTNAYPWMASLQYDGQPYCGGSLIGGDGVFAQWVLTAAHCWVDDFGNVLPFDEHDTVVLGEHDFATISGDEVVSHIAEVHMYPGYYNFPYSYDLALVKLDAPVPVSDVISPIAIAHVNNLEHFPATTIGWGDTSYGGLPSDVLLEAQIEIFPDSLCAIYGTSFNPDTMVCAGAPDYSADACQSDSGGPLFIQEEFGSYLLVGVTSFGRGCATPDYPGVYADVAGGLAWVYSLLYPSTVCVDQSSIPQSECEVLTDLWIEGCLGDSCTAPLVNWFADPDPCLWEGVACTDGHVTGVDLSSSGLSGYIPYTISDLSFLQSLNMGDNNLYGRIPTEIGNLLDLESLFLQGNMLNGGIPTSLGYLNNLTALDLTGGQLTGSIPAELGSLSLLTYLSLSANPLSGTLPPELGNLVNMQDMHFNETNLSGSIPLEFMQIEGLNSFGYQYTDICEPQTLEFQAWLAGIPYVLGTDNPCSVCSTQIDVPQAECVALEAFYNSTDGDNWLDNTGWKVDENVCSWYAVGCDAGHVGSIDFNIGMASDNHLTGVLPPEIGDLTYLKELRIPNNAISGPLPAEFFGLSGLEVLDLENNLLDGAIPTAISGLTALQTLNLRENAFSGALPAEIFQLSNLISLVLAENNLDGSLSADIQNLTNLSTLDLSGNALSGSLPSELGNIPNLTWIYLSQNAFTGNIPESWGYLSSLNRLNLSNNQLQGVIPLSFEGRQFYFLDLSNNQLTGAIPNLQTVDATYISTYMYLNNNQLTGAIPTSFSATSYVNLSYNQLSGDIPLFYAKSVDFSHNNLDGSFYETDGYAGMTAYADYSYNQIGGEIPDLFLSKDTLNLSHNNFTGSIPTTNFLDVKLRDLDLSANQLSGELPVEMVNSFGLSRLLVNDNNFIGGIPEAYVDLPMQTFYFDNTGICAPDTPEMQTWLDSITDLQTTGSICSVPVASFLAPVEGGIVIQPRSWVMANAEDPVSGMKQVEFYANLNGTWTLLAVDTTEEDGWRYLWPTYAIEQPTVDLKLVAVNTQNFQTVVTMEGLTVTDHFTSPEGYQSRGSRPTSVEPVESAQPESQIEQPTSQVEQQPANQTEQPASQVEQQSANQTEQPANQIAPSFESQESASPPRVVMERKITPMEHVMTNFRFKFWWFAPLRMPY